jgi:hypothetical protein
MLLGQEVETDDGLMWRVKWGQRGAGFFWFFAAMLFIAGHKTIVTVVFCILGAIFTCTIFYKNLSLAIIKRLLKEPSVVIIIASTIANWSIDIVRPIDSLSPINGLMYMLAVCAFGFVDAMKIKSRLFTIVVGTLFVLLNINNIYGNIFGNTNQGVVLFKYTIKGNEYAFMKRSVKRSIFLQIMLFSAAAVYIIFKDRKQELMIFATGHIYRETGTASKKVGDKQYSEKIKSEKRILSV